MRVLFFGDIVGHVGLTAVSGVLASIKEKLHVDFVIANGENVSKGKGLLYKDYAELAQFADAITLGNHYHSKDAIDGYIKYADKLVRPLNLLHYEKGEGSRVFECKGVKIRVTNILAEAFMNEAVKKPIDTLDKLVSDCEEAIHIVDFHGESSSEKQIFGFMFDGLVSAVIGTHTHVQTADARILEKGTAYMTDVGYCGAYDTVIGFDKDSVIDKIVYDAGRIYVPTEAPTCVNCLLLDIDEKDGSVTYLRPYYFINGKERNYGESHL
jgi:metallophosphoesterase (TIGR00282 family)